MAGKPKYNKNKRKLPRQPNGLAYRAWVRECASRAAKFHALRSRGWTLEKIATEHGISRQRVHQILAAGEE